MQIFPFLKFQAEMQTLQTSHRSQVLYGQTHAKETWTGT